jgi:hypothetical protein
MAAVTTLPAAFTVGQVLTSTQMNDLRGAFRVLQIVQGTSNTGISSTSASYVDTGLSVSITPSSVNSKVLVFATHTVYTNANVTSCAVRIVRTATTLTQSTDQMYNPVGGGGIGTWSLMDLDNPATTSATTYKTTFARNSGAGTVSLNSGSNDARIIVMEISA